MTTYMLNEFVEKIVVHERDRKGSIETSAEGKRVERKPAQRSEQSSKKKPKKRESVIKRLREKQIAIAVKSGKPVPRYLEQDMERRRG